MGGRSVVEAGWVRGSLSNKLSEGGAEGGLGRTRTGLEAGFGEGMSIEDDPYHGWGRSREDLGGECGAFDMVEREAGTVEQHIIVPVGVGDGIQVPCGNAWLEDEAFMGFRDAATIIDNGERTIAAGFQSGGDVDIACASVARIAQKLQKRVLDKVDAPRAAQKSFGAR